MYLITCFFCAAWLGIGHVSAATDMPSARASSYTIMEAEAKREAALTIYGTTSENFARFLIDDFKSLYPAIVVTYVALPAPELDARMRREAGASAGPDVVWSGGMDFQMRAVVDGLASSYKSPEASTLPEWAKWKDQVYATSYEPVVLMYNRRLVPPDEIPTTHDKLTETLVKSREKYRGKVTTYALDNAELGSVPFELDAAYDPHFWSLARAMRAADVNTVNSSATMIEHITSGQSLIAYNVAGAEAIRRARRDPSIGVQFTQDYNLVLSRLIFISKTALHPNAAKIWVDYVLSKRGQQQMRVADLYPIREDVSGTDPGLTLLRGASGIAKPTALNAKLAQLFELSRFRQFQKKWASTVASEAWVTPRRDGYAPTASGH